MKRLFFAIAIALIGLTAFTSDPPGTKVPIGLVVGAGKTKTVIDSTELKRIKEIDNKVSLDSLQSATDQFYTKTQSNARFINEDGDTITGIINVPTAAAGTNTTQAASTAFVTNADTKDQFTRALALMGSTIKALPIGLSPNAGATYTFVDNTLVGCLFNIETAMTISEVRFKLQTQGAYTADNANSIALFSLSNGTCTRVAITADDGTIWKAAANSSQTFAFTSSHSASPGLYAVCALYNCSGTATTTPKIYAGQGWGQNIINMFYPLNSNSEKLYFTLSGQNTMPTSFTMASCSSADFPVIFILK